MSLKLKSLLESLPAIIVSTLIVVGIAFAWTEPTQTPPNGNTPPPLNTSSTGQSKAGGLILNTGGAATGLIVDKGNVGIGTQTPKGNLQVGNNLLFNQKDGNTNTIISNNAYVNNWASGTSNWNYLNNGKAYYVAMGGNLWPGNVGGITLGVAGNGTKDAVVSDFNSETKRFFLKDDGNVGIGTMLPTQKLDVVGYIKGRSGLCIGNDCRTSWPSGASQQVKIFSGHNVTPGNCSGTFVGGLCNGGYYVNIAFPTPFASPPHVLVTPELVSNQTGCVGQATDQTSAYPTNITTTGFRLWANGSPENGTCGAYEGWSTYAKAGWLAIGY